MSDNQQLTTGGNGGAVVAHEGGIPTEQRLALLREALTNPDVQPEKAVAMAELMFKLEDRDARARFIAAKVRAISEMPHIGKDGINTHTNNRYSTWEKMQPLITPVLTRNGLVLNFAVGQDGGRVAVTPILSGHGWEERGDAMALPADVGKGRNDVQAVGSSVSYGKRYAAMAMLNLISRGVSEDDDGNAGGGGGSDPYAMLAPHERQLVDDGRSAATEGMEPYANWFKSLTTEQRGFLSFNRASGGKTWHDQNKECAAQVG